MTGQVLRVWLNSLNDEQLSADVSIYCKKMDEYFTLQDTDLSVGSDVIEDNQPVLIVDI